MRVEENHALLTSGSVSCPGKVNGFNKRLAAILVTEQKQFLYRVSLASPVYIHIAVGSGI